MFYQDSSDSDVSRDLSEGVPAHPHHVGDGRGRLLTDAIDVRGGSPGIDTADRALTGQSVRAFTRTLERAEAGQRGSDDDSEAERTRGGAQPGSFRITTTVPVRTTETPNSAPVMGGGYSAQVKRFTAMASSSDEGEDAGMLKRGAPEVSHSQTVRAFKQMESDSSSSSSNGYSRGRSKDVGGHGGRGLAAYAADRTSVPSRATPAVEVAGRRLPELSSPRTSTASGPPTPVLSSVLSQVRESDTQGVAPPPSMPRPRQVTEHARSDGLHDDVSSGDHVYPDHDEHDHDDARGTLGDRLPGLRSAAEPRREALVSRAVAAPPRPQPLGRSTGVIDSVSDPLGLPFTSADVSTESGASAAAQAAIEAEEGRALGSERVYSTVDEELDHERSPSTGSHLPHRDGEEEEETEGAWAHARVAERTAWGEHKGGQPTAGEVYETWQHLGVAGASDARSATPTVRERAAGPLVASSRGTPAEICATSGREVPVSTHEGDTQSEGSSYRVPSATSTSSASRCDAAAVVEGGSTTRPIAAEPPRTQEPPASLSPDRIPYTSSEGLESSHGSAESSHVSDSADPASSRASPEPDLQRGPRDATGVQAVDTSPTSPIVTAGAPADEWSISEQHDVLPPGCPGAQDTSADSSAAALSAAASDAVWSESVERIEEMGGECGELLSQPSSPMASSPEVCTSPRDLPQRARAPAEASVVASTASTAAALLRARERFPIEEADQWSAALATLPVLDATVRTCVLDASASPLLETSAGGGSYVKVLSLLSRPPVHELFAARAMAGERAAEDTDDDAEPVAGLVTGGGGRGVGGGSSGGGAWASSTRRRERAVLQAAAQLLALDMFETQQRMAEAGLVARCREPSACGVAGSAEHSEDEDMTSPAAAEDGRGGTTFVCRGITSLHVDADCRLIAGVDVEPCTISMLDLVAYQAAPLQAEELVALLKSCTSAVAALHARGFTHGLLHGGNVLLSSDDGRTTLTQPGGVMSSYVLPTDHSALAPRRAVALRPVVRTIWGGMARDGATRHAATATAAGARLGQRPMPPHVEDQLTAFALDTLAADLVPQPAREAAAASTYHPYTPSAADDVYALGNLALLLLLGVPVFHDSRLLDVVETLADLVAEVDAHMVDNDSAHGQGLHGSAPPPSSQRRDLCMRFVSRVLYSDFALARYRQAGYTPDFVHELEAFVADCLYSGCVGGCLADGAQPPPSSSPDGVVYDSATALLQHPLLRRLVAGGSGDDAGRADVADAAAAMSEEEVQDIREAVHRLAYPVYTSREAARVQCGTTPYLSRLHRNSLFAARWAALRGTAGERLADAHALHTSAALVHRASPSPRGREPMNAQWPYLEGAAGCWTVALPSVHSCHAQLQGGAGWGPAQVSRAAGVAEASRAASEPAGDDTASARGSSAEAPLLAPSLAAAARESLEVVKECALHLPLHALAFAGKDGMALRLSDEDLGPLRGAVDTLILKDLEHCYVEVTTHVRFIIVAHVRHCELVLGPCFACYVYDVHHCSTFAVAARHLMLDHVTDVRLMYAGIHPPTALTGDPSAGEDASEDCSDDAGGEDGGRGGSRARAEPADVSIARVHVHPYSVVYPGLSEDFAAVGLSQEHTTTIDAAFGSVDATPAPRQFTFLAPDGTGHDYPYSHALAAHGRRFTHAEDGVSDVYLFFRELHGKDVLITHVHGGAEHSPQRYGLATATAAAVANLTTSYECVKDSQWTRGPDADAPVELACRGPTGGRYPLIFILDVVEDVVISDCSACTVFVLGAHSSVVVRRCANMRVFLLSREVYVMDCVDVDVFAFATEYIALDRCDGVVLSPLFTQCPFFDVILERVLLEASPERRDAVFDAFENRDVWELNVVLRGTGGGAEASEADDAAMDRCVELNECVNTTVKDVQWYEQNAGDEVPVMVVVRVPVSVMDGSSAHADGEEDSLNPALTACGFFAECATADGKDLAMDFAPMSLAQLLYNGPPSPTLAAALPLTGEEAFRGEGGDAVVRPIQRLHDLVNPRLLRLPGSLELRDPSRRTPASLLDASAGNGGLTGGPACDLVLERIAMGEVHVVDAVGTLWIRNCTGPLEICVCAAQEVVMDRCESVVVRVACRTFAAQDCHGCHVALHVNTPPRYLRCSGMLSSTLNMTAANMAEHLASAGVQQEANQFDCPVILPPNEENVHLGGTPGVPEAAGASTAAQSMTRPHMFSSESDRDAHPSTLSAPVAAAVDSDGVVDTLHQAFAYMRAPLALVAPLPSIVLGVDDADVLSSLDARVRREEGEGEGARAPAEVGLAAALGFLAAYDLHEQVESEVAPTATAVAAADASSGVADTRARTEATVAVLREDAPEPVVAQTAAHPTLTKDGVTPSRAPPPPPPPPLTAAPLDEAVALVGTVRTTPPHPRAAPAVPVLLAPPASPEAVSGDSPVRSHNTAERQVVAGDSEEVVVDLDKGGRAPVLSPCPTVDSESESEGEGVVIIHRPPHMTRRPSSAAAGGSGVLGAEPRPRLPTSTPEKACESNDEEEEAEGQRRAQPLSCHPQQDPPPEDRGRASQRRRPLMPPPPPPPPPPLQDDSTGEACTVAEAAVEARAATPAVELAHHDIPATTSPTATVRTPLEGATPSVERQTVGVREGDVSQSTSLRMVFTPATPGTAACGVDRYGEYTDSVEVLEEKTTTVATVSATTTPDGHARALLDGPALATAAGVAGGGGVAGAASSSAGAESLSDGAARVLSSCTMAAADAMDAGVMTAPQPTNSGAKVDGLTPSNGVVHAELAAGPTGRPLAGPVIQQGTTASPAQRAGTARDVLPQDISPPRAHHQDPARGYGHEPKPAVVPTAEAEEPEPPLSMVSASRGSAAPTGAGSLPPIVAAAPGEVARVDEATHAAAGARRGAGERQRALAAARARHAEARRTMSEEELSRRVALAVQLVNRL